MSSKTAEKKKKWSKITPTKDEHNSWKARIQKANKSKWTPALKASFQRQAKSFQLCELRKKKCKRMAKTNMMSRAAWATGMSMWTPTSSNFRAPAVERQAKTQECLGAMKKLQRMVSSDADDDVDVEDEEDLQRSIVRSAAADRELEEMEEEILEAGGGEAESEMEKLLNELRKEPSDDKGRAAKFSLYETYQETIQESRKGLFKFWADCKKEFVGDKKDEDSAAVKEVNASLKRVDDPRNLGFPDMRGDTWFVYHMAVKVTKNNSMLGDVLKGIQTKLDLLSRQEDCPICLEELDEDPAVLGCCHKTCSECWANWKMMQGDNAFCPLCKHNDFLGTVMCDDDE
jgi:hypothetical protein